jgi:hypothetical protein
MGGNHLRWWQQADTSAFFFAVGQELDLATSHMIAQNGYNNGRDYLGGCIKNAARESIIWLTDCVSQSATQR